MPNKNQKNKPNGFIIYANEIRDELLREGHVIRSMPDLIAAASPRWNGLPADEREYYKDRAKWEWENSRNSNAAQYMKRPVRPGASAGGRVDTIKVNENIKQNERTEVFSSFPPGRAVTEKRFYFVTFICLLEEPKAQPIEVAAVEFSLLGGILRTWHKHINPGTIAQGYTYLAQQISERTHLIPVEGIAEPGDTYTSIYDELLYFLSRGTNHIPPIHVKMSDCEKVEECIKWLAANAGRPHQLKRIYELEGLILDLDFHMKGLPQDFHQSKQNATEMISSTLYDWDMESKCKFHQENETKVCARGYLQKYCFQIAQYFACVHNVPLTERHQPVQKNEKLYTLINGHPRERSKPCGSDKTKEGIEREAMARQITEQLSKTKIIEDRRMAEDELERKELEAERIKQEQKRRWLSLRGGGEESETSANCDFSNKGASSPDGCGQQTQAPRPVWGRGRGRGRGSNVSYSLRRPGDQTASVMGESSEGNKKPVLSFGRGTKMYTGN